VLTMKVYWVALAFKPAPRQTVEWADPDAGR